MNSNIHQLYTIAQKKERIIIGLMSGTSLDGLDIALCKFEGNGKKTKTKLLQFETISYDIFFRNEVKSIFSKLNINLQKLCLLNAFIAKQHALMVNNCLQKWNYKKEEIDLIASHGQTIYHAPKNLHQQKEYDNATLQIGDADQIAVNTGIITIADFRQKHIAAGGEGAPLALYGDYLLFTHEKENRIMLNIGGIANFTFLPGNFSDEEIVCTDTGPGNTIMDAFVCKHFTPLTYDKDGVLAGKGTVNKLLLAALKKHDFFIKPFPKTTGPELFNLDYLQTAQQTSNTLSLNNFDVLATLNKFTAETIADAIKTTLPNIPSTIFVSGGGKHNKILLKNLQVALPEHSFKNIDDLGINADAKEAVLFAVLANECVAGNGFHFNNLPNVNFGKISFPN